jgi:hypothetical protein
MNGPQTTKIYIFLLTKMSFSQNNIFNNAKLLHVSVTAIMYWITYCSTEHCMSMYWNVCLMLVTVTETCSKYYIIEYIVVLWLNDISVTTTTQRDGSYKKYIFFLFQLNANNVLNTYIYHLLNFWHRSFIFNSNKSPTLYKNFSVHYRDVCLQLNMFRAFYRPSSWA